MMRKNSLPYYPIAAQPVIKRGCWCPHCRSQNTHATTLPKGVAITGLIIASLVIPLFGFFGIPAIVVTAFSKRGYACRDCGNAWRV